MGGGGGTGRHAPGAGRGCTPRCSTAAASWTAYAADGGARAPRPRPDRGRSPSVCAGSAAAGTSSPRTSASEAPCCPRGRTRHPAAMDVRAANERISISQMLNPTAELQCWGTHETRRIGDSLTRNTSPPKKRPPGKICETQPSFFLELSCRLVCCHTLTSSLAKKLNTVETPPCCVLYLAVTFQQENEEGIPRKRQ